MSTSSNSSPSNTHNPNSDSTLMEWLDYIQQIHVSAIDMGLSRVLPVTEKLGIVQSAKDNAYVFTVAGTNGKGSTTAMISEICQSAGYKTALYQSPHLSHFNERVRIDGEMVSDQTLINAFSQVEAARLQCELTLSFFEMTTLAALLIFAEAGCDVWVLEVGLGGRLDVVNIIDPDIAVITNIGIDHVDWLGDNVEDIGSEKAGILRDGITLVYGADAMPNSVQLLVTKHDVTCYQAGRDFSYNITDEHTWQYSNGAVTLQLPRPALSLVNTANALSAVLASRLKIESAAIKQALQTVQLAGRFDYRKVAERYWLFDVAHNEQGVAFLLDQLPTLWQEHLSRKPAKLPASIRVLFSMLADKDIALVVQRLVAADLPLTDWYVAQIDHPRAASVEQLQAALFAYTADFAKEGIKNIRVHLYDDLQQATRAVIADSLPQDLILVSGSFHTIGEALTFLEG